MTERVKQAVARRWNVVWERAVFRMRTSSAQDGYVCRDILGSKMYLDVNDPGISRELILRGIREVWGTEVMKELLRPGQTIVDIGANIGYYALLEAKSVGPTGHVYAIEPVPTNYELLLRNVKLNGYKNVTTFELAIGDRTGTTEMHISHLRNWHSVTDAHATGKVIQVNLTTLDTFLVGKPDPFLVRMDVEGYEYEILQGMKETLARSRDLILYIEIHPHLMGAKKTRAMLELLSDSGYEILRITSRGQEENYTIRSLVADAPALAGERGGFLVFFGRKMTGAR